jgi:hypothetical protein
LAPEINASSNENVFGVDSNADILWQIQPRKYIYEDSPYTNITKKDNFVKLSNWDGTDLIVAPSTGKIIKESYGK